MVVSTHLKIISQIGSFPQVGVNIKNIWNHHTDNISPFFYYGFNLFFNYVGLIKGEFSKMMVNNTLTNLVGGWTTHLKNISQIGNLP